MSSPDRYHERVSEEAAREAAEFYLKGLNDLEFVWKGRPAAPSTAATLRAAFRLTAEGEKPVEKLELLDWNPTDYFYITDQKQHNPLADSRSLSNKYGSEARLLPGTTYYICQI